MRPPSAQAVRAVQDVIMHRSRDVLHTSTFSQLREYSTVRRLDTVIHSPAQIAVSSFHRTQEG